MLEPYPDSKRARDQWIVRQRGDRVTLDALRPHAFFHEAEIQANASISSVATILLTNRECPWRCLMCDLWKHTLTGTVPAGAIPAQIDFALARLPAASLVKLYNSGSFFDPRAIPVAEYPLIAARLKPFQRVIVECHPALVNDRAARFRDLCSGQLEVALGLETIHPTVLDRLNKGITVERFAGAAEFLRAAQIDLRAFVLLRPPFLTEEEGLAWSLRSVEFAFDCGATAVSIIPTRPGNGALDALAQLGQFAPPSLASLEAALTAGIALGRGRVFADLWNLELFASCPDCFPARRQRLEQMNLTQTPIPSITCACGPAAQPAETRPRRAQHVSRALAASTQKAAL